MEIINKILEDKTFRIIAISLIVLLIVAFVTFFIQYNIDRSNGKHAKFLWFESNIPSKQTNQNEKETIATSKIDSLKKFDSVTNQNNEKNKQVDMTKSKNEVSGTNYGNVGNQSTEIKNSKNVNTGTNYGNIGDRYEGVKQRHLTETDAKQLIDEIEQYKKQNSEKINPSHITIGWPGDKESTILAQEVEKVLRINGFNKIEASTLVTYGSGFGKKFEISNAPDNTIMIMIYQADNVE